MYALKLTQETLVDLHMGQCNKTSSAFENSYLVRWKRGDGLRSKMHGGKGKLKVAILPCSETTLGQRLYSFFSLQHEKAVFSPRTLRILAISALRIEIMAVSMNNCCAS